MRVLGRIVWSTLLLLSPVIPALAQTEAPEFIQIVSTTAKIGAITEYETYVKRIIAGAAKINAPQRVLAYQETLGGTPNTYHFVIVMNKWADLDAFPSVPRILTQAYGDAEGARILDAGRDAIDHSSSAVYRVRRDLSTRPRANDPPSPFVMLVRTEIDPEMAPSYEQFLIRLKTAQEQEPGTRSVNRSVSVLGPAMVYLGANFFSTHAERDHWTAVPDLLRKAHGEFEGRQLWENSLRAVRTREIVILAYRSDLSRASVARR